MKWTLLISGIISVAFSSGFLLCGWVRQEMLDELRRELRQCQDGRARLQEVVGELTTELKAFRRALGEDV